MESRRVPTWLYMILNIPFGVPSGYISVTLAYQLKEAGFNVQDVAGLVALNILPHTWKFFWSPVVDITLSQKKWHVLSTALTSIGVAASGFYSAEVDGLAALAWLVFLTSLAGTVIAMATESLIAHCTPDELKGSAAGWFAAGNLGGSGVGGGLGLLLVEWKGELWIASSALGALSFACCAALWFMPSPEHPHRHLTVGQSLAATLRDVWQVARRWMGFVAMVLCVLPLGVGAASGLFAAMADDWGAKAETVAIVTGILGGVISMFGCLAGGWICDRMDRKAAYTWFGVLMAGAAVAMAVLPRTEATYVVCTLVYTFITGMAYAGYSAFVFEAIGAGAAATKCTAFASLANIPIYYMTLVDGWAYENATSIGNWNSADALLYVDAAMGMVGAAVFVLLVMLPVGRRGRGRDGA